MKNKTGMISIGLAFLAISACKTRTSQEGSDVQSVATGTSCYKYDGVTEGAGYTIESKYSMVELQDVTVNNGKLLVYDLPDNVSEGTEVNIGSGDITHRPLFGDKCSKTTWESIKIRCEGGNWKLIEAKVWADSEVKPGWFNCHKNLDIDFSAEYNGIKTTVKIGYNN